MRVDPPVRPVHVRPYGPARRTLMAHYSGPLTAQQADQIREVITTRLPGWNVLIVDDRWTLTTDQPEPEHWRTNP